MAFSEAQYEAIQKAFASGVEEVVFDGKRTKYRSLAEMERVMAVMRADLDRQAGVRGPGYSVAHMRRG